MDLRHSYHLLITASGGWSTCLAVDRAVCVPQVRPNIPDVSQICRGADKPRNKAAKISDIWHNSTLHIVWLDHYKAMKYNDTPDMDPCWRRPSWRHSEVRTLSQSKLRQSAYVVNTGVLRNDVNKFIPGWRRRVRSPRSAEVWSDVINRTRRLKTSPQPAVVYACIWCVTIGS